MSVPISALRLNTELKRLKAQLAEECAKNAKLEKRLASLQESLNEVSEQLKADRGGSNGKIGGWGAAWGTGVAVACSVVVVGLTMWSR